jgi:hypothetical protein
MLNAYPDPDPGPGSVADPDLGFRYLFDPLDPGFG